MTAVQLRDFFLWCAIINMGLLLWWFLIMAMARNWVYKFHSRWFPMPRETFAAIHYKGLACYKIAIFMFNVVPYVAMLIICNQIAS